jgi:hypothetical protein
MKPAALGFLAGVVATIGGAALSGAHLAPTMFAAGAATAAGALAIAIGSRKRMQAAARFLEALATALGAAAPQPGRGKARRPVELAPAAAAIEADLTSALVNLSARRPAAAAIARQVIADNPGAELQRLIQLASQQTRKGKQAA